MLFKMVFNTERAKASFVLRNLKKYIFDENALNSHALRRVS